MKGDLERPIAHSEVARGVQDLLGRFGRIGLGAVHRGPAAFRERPAGERRPGVVLERERRAHDLGHPRVLGGQRGRDRVQLPLDPVDGGARRRPALHVGEAGQRRVAFEERATGQNPVAVRVRQRLGFRRQPPVLVLQCVRQLVRDEQLADEVTAGEQRQESDCGPARPERLGREHELLRPRVVEGGDLSPVEILERGAQCGAGGQQAEPLVDGRDALEVVSRIGQIDVATDPRGDVGGRERDGGDRAAEVLAAERRQVADDGREGVRVHPSVVHDPAADAAGGQRDGEEHGAAAHGRQSSMITTG